MSSSPAPEPSQAYAFDCIDVSRLIEEVRRRAPIWDKQLPDYQDRSLRAQLWGEVCQQLYSGYNNLNFADKKQTSVNLQKKWRNLRDAFAKELLIQNRVHLKIDKRGYRKKRKYIHFEALSFLASNSPNKRTRYTHVNIDEDSNFSIDDDDNDDGRVKKTKRTKKDGNNSKTTINYTQEKPEETTNTRPQDSATNHKIYDEDISFTEMLVPMLKKLDEDQKHYAKTEIMNILYQAKSHGAAHVVHNITVKQQQPSDEESDPFD